MSFDKTFSNTIGEVTDSCLGKMLDAKKNKGKYAPYLANVNVRWGSFDLSDLPQMRFEENEQERYGIRYGDIIMCEGGEPGRCAIWRDEIPGMKIQKALHRIRTREQLDNEYLYYWFLNEGRKGSLDAYFTGSTIKHLPGEKLKSIFITYPDITVQRRIASVLSLLDAKIKLNTQINNNLLQQAQALFAKEFLSFDTMPDDWKKSSLLGIADYLNGLAMQKFRPKDDENGLPVLKIKELRQGSCDASSELCSPSIKKEYIVHDGDVIFSWSGSLLVDFWCGGTCGLNQHLFKVTSTSFDKWFYFAWTNHHLQKFAAIAADMATTMGHIKREELAKAEVLVPPQAEYERIGGLLAPIYDLVIANRIENRKLATLRDELLPRLMSGDLDVSEVSI